MYELKIFKPFVSLIAFAVLFSGFGNIQAQEENGIIKEDIEVTDKITNADITESKTGEISKVITSINDEEISLDTTLTNNFDTVEIKLN